MNRGKSGVLSDSEVEALNDSLAREHDIDDYYQESNVVIRAIERQRLAVVRQLAAPRAGERLLEVGCGGGYVLREFPECQLTGVDVSGVVLEKARRNLAGLPVQLIKGQLGNVGLAHEHYDILICTEVLEHTIEPRRVLDQLRALSHEHSRIVVTFPNDRLINLFKKLITKSSVHRLPGIGRVAWGGDDHHLHVWSVAQMRALLGEYFVVDAERHVPSRLLPIRCCFGCRI